MVRVRDRVRVRVRYQDRVRVTIRGGLISTHTYMQGRVSGMRSNESGTLGLGLVLGCDHHSGESSADRIQNAMAKGT